MTRTVVRSETRHSAGKRAQIEIIPLEAEHAREIMQQDEQAYGPKLTRDLAACEALAAAGGYTVLAGGRVIACLGICPMRPGVGTGWGILSRDAGPYFVAISRAIMRLLKASGFLRVQTTVAVDFPDGHRWARLLGFHIEGRMVGYFADGKDAFLYAWLSQPIDRRH